MAQNKYAILTANSRPTLALQKILRSYGIDPNLSFAQIITATQRAWLRPAGTERWQLTETFSPAEQKELLPLFNEAGLFASQFPKQRKYRYFLVMGGDLPANKERIEFMLNLLHQGIRAEQIVFLTCQRELDPIHEKEARTDTIKTECQSLQQLYEQAIANTAHEIPSVAWINTPNQIREGKIYRATTPDTVRAWLAQNPKPGSCLMISGQPLLGYQESVLETLLPISFHIESAGPHADDDVTIPEFLDTLTRWLYQEGLRRAKAYPDTAL